MDFDALKDQWTELGSDDPLWAVLSADDVRHGSWNEQEFFATGEAAVADVLTIVRAFRPDFAHREAVDFGCGVGRLSQSLAHHFDHVLGVDISFPMIEAARSLNRHGDRCQFVANQRPDLGQIPTGSVDFVLSLIVLQHMAAEYATSYIGEFIRVLSPAGLAVFQAPARHRPPVEQFRLGPGGYRASLIPLTRDISLRPGELTFVPVSVRNVGDATWIERPAGYTGDIRFRLGKHLFDASGAQLSEDDERAALPDSLPPGQAIEMGLPLRAPLIPGQYRVVLDMVHEHITWFADMGSSQAELTLTVLADAPAAELAASAAGTASDSPAPISAGPAPIQMHCLTEDQVRLTVESAGGRVLAMWLSADSGSDWDSIDYLVCPAMP